MEERGEEIDGHWIGLLYIVLTDIFLASLSDFELIKYTKRFELTP
jgi:hypothetical protein